jgi:hypothetical protein
MTPTILTFPTVANPATIDWLIERKDGRFESPLAGTYQDIVRPGARWLANMSWKVLSNDDQQELIAWCVQMSRGDVRTALPNFAYLARGSLAGSPEVNGAGQTGYSLATKGWTHSATAVLKAGDMFQVTDGTLHQLLMVTATANANGSGNSSVAIEPSLRIQPSDSSALVVSAPSAYFSFTKPTFAASYTPPRRAALSIALVEDIQL